MNPSSMNDNWQDRILDLSTQINGILQESTIYDDLSAGSTTHHPLATTHTVSNTAMPSHIPSVNTLLMNSGNQMGSDALPSSMMSPHMHMQLPHVSHVGNETINAQNASNWAIPHLSWVLTNAAPAINAQNDGINNASPATIESPTRKAIIPANHTELQIPTTTTAGRKRSLKKSRSATDVETNTVTEPSEQMPKKQKADRKKGQSKLSKGGQSAMNNSIHANPEMYKYIYPIIPSSANAQQQVSLHNAFDTKHHQQGVQQHPNGLGQRHPSMNFSSMDDERFSEYLLDDPEEASPNSSTIPFANTETNNTMMIQHPQLDSVGHPLQLQGVPMIYANGQAMLTLDPMIQFGNPFMATNNMVLQSYAAQYANFHPQGLQIAADQPNLHSWNHIMYIKPLGQPDAITAASTRTNDKSSPSCNQAQEATNPNNERQEKAMEMDPIPNTPSNPTTILSQHGSETLSSMPSTEIYPFTAPFAPAADPPTISSQHMDESLLQQEQSKQSGKEKTTETKSRKESGSKKASRSKKNASVIDQNTLPIHTPNSQPYEMVKSNAKTEAEKVAAPFILVHPTKESLDDPKSYAMPFTRLPMELSSAGTTNYTHKRCLRATGQPTNIIVDESVDRQTLKRLRNRVSASRCRTKKKEWVHDLEDRYDDLKRQKCFQENRIKMLNEAVAYCKMVLAN